MAPCALLQRAPMTNICASGNQREISLRDCPRSSSISARRVAIVATGISALRDSSELSNELYEAGRTILPRECRVRGPTTNFADLLPEVRKLQQRQDMSPSPAQC